MNEQQQVSTKFPDIALKFLSESYTIALKNSTIRSSVTTSFESKLNADLYLAFLTNTFDVQPLIKQLMKSKYWNPLKPVLCILNGPFLHEVDSLVHVRQILNMFLKYSMKNVDIMMNTNQSIVTFAWFPFEIGNKCGQAINRISIRSKCEFMDDYKLKIYDRFRPKIPHNLHNCPVNVSFLKWEPFTFNFNDKKKGIDTRLIETIAAKINAKIVLGLANITRDAESIYDHMINE